MTIVQTWCIYYENIEKKLFLELLKARKKNRKYIFYKKRFLFLYYLGINKHEILLFILNVIFQFNFFLFLFFSAIITVYSFHLFISLFYEKTILHWFILIHIYFFLSSAHIQCFSYYTLSTHSLLFSVKSCFTKYPLQLSLHILHIFWLYLFSTVSNILTDHNFLWSIFIYIIVCQLWYTISINRHDTNLLLH